MKVTVPPATVYREDETCAVKVTTAPLMGLSGAVNKEVVVRIAPGPRGGNRHRESAQQHWHQSAQRYLSERQTAPKSYDGKVRHGSRSSNCYVLVRLCGLKKQHGTRKAVIHRSGLLAHRWSWIANLRQLLENTFLLTHCYYPYVGFSNSVRLLATRNFCQQLPEEGVGNIRRIALCTHRHWYSSRTVKRIERARTSLWIKENF